MAIEFFMPMEPPTVTAQEHKVAVIKDRNMRRNTMQKVVRTVPTRKGYWYDEEKMEYLSELLKNGWKVVMCNRIGEDLEYIK